MKGQPDYFWRKSKEHGYPARSVWKLQEMQERFRLLAPGARVLDLGCSPGSWSLAALDLVAPPGRVVGVDMKEPDPRLLARPGFTFVRGDFTSAETMERIAALGPFDVVLSDAAPSTTGNRVLDTSRSLGIARAALGACAVFLVPGGNFALKIFQGGEEGDVRSEMRKCFAEVRAFKPRASRSDSMEIYYVGLRHLRPAG